MGVFQGWRGGRIASRPQQSNLYSHIHPSDSQSNQCNFVDPISNYEVIKREEQEQAG